MLAWPAFRKRDANPHAALLCERLRDLGVAVDDWTPARAALRAVDLWHLHHPESVVYLRSRLRSTLTTLAFCALLALARARGTRILWTVHDLGSHDRLHPTLEAWFWPFFVSRVDAYVCLSEGGPRLARERFPGLRGRPGFTVPHGHYRDAYPNQVSRAQARRALGLPEQARVLLHFGLVRPYKNVPHLIRTFRELPQSEAVLLVAGKPYDAIVEREVRLSAEGCPRVRLLLRWISPAEVQHLFVASDLVVLPYRHILNSGTVFLALSFGRPVLVPDKGAMREQRKRFGPEWVRLYAGDLCARPGRSDGVGHRHPASRTARFRGARLAEPGREDLRHLPGRARRRRSPAHAAAGHEPGGWHGDAGAVGGSAAVRAGRGMKLRKPDPPIFGGAWPEGECTAGPSV